MSLKREIIKRHFRFVQSNRNIVHFTWSAEKCLLFFLTKRKSSLFRQVFLKNICKKYIFSWDFLFFLVFLPAKYLKRCSLSRGFHTIDILVEQKQSFYEQSINDDHNKIYNNNNNMFEFICFVLSKWFYPVPNGLTNRKREQIILEIRRQLWLFQRVLLRCFLYNKSILCLNTSRKNIEF